MQPVKQETLCRGPSDKQAKGLCVAKGRSEIGQQTQQDTKSIPETREQEVSSIEGEVKVERRSNRSADTHTR